MADPRSAAEENMNNDIRRTSIVRMGIAALAAAPFFYVAAVAAAWSEWSIIEDPVERWKNEQDDIIQLLILSAVLGLIGIVVARLIMRRSPASWWLLCCLLIPLWEIWRLSERGVIP